MILKSDKTAFVNNARGFRIRLVKLLCVGCVENVHHRQEAKFSQRRQLFFDGRFFEVLLVNETWASERTPSAEQTERLKKGHKLRLKRSDLITVKNFN